ncbi:MAG: hypothetical protein ACR2RB_06850 [Gammaproteobacteria bacterium]
MDISDHGVHGRFSRSFGLIQSLPGSADQPQETVVIDKAQWETMVDMHKYLGDIKGTLTFEEMVDNSFAQKAAQKLSK